MQDDGETWASNLWIILGGLSEQSGGRGDPSVHLAKAARMSWSRECDAGRLETLPRCSFALLSFLHMMGSSYLFGPGTFLRVQKMSLAPHGETRWALTSKRCKKVKPHDTEAPTSR